jgi:predicted DNA-binding protein (MmcQ/YjbR family)
MNIETFREYCLSKPAATEGTPFGPDNIVFKVEGKMFALAALDEVPPAVNLKCDPDLALELRDRYAQVRPGYHMNKKHWNTVELDGVIPEKEIRKMVDHSYDLVGQSLPKAKRPRRQVGRARST